MSEEYADKMPVKGADFGVPLEMMSQAIAVRNHGRTLRQLHESGGMTPYEIICNIRGWRDEHNNQLTHEISLSGCSGRWSSPT